MRRILKLSSVALIAAVGALMLPTTTLAQSLNELACAASIYCAPKVTALDAQIVYNLTEAQAQAAFINASKDWPDQAWRCAAGGACGANTRLETQIMIGLPEQAYGQAELLRAQGPQAEPNKNTEPPPARKPQPPNVTPAAPPIVVESLPKPGTGTLREITIGNGAVVDEIQPLDGLWTLTNGATKTLGCMAGIAENVGKGLPGPQSGQKVFEKPFQASAMIKNDSVKWRRVATNHHEAQVTPSGKAMDMSFDLRVLNPSQMQGNSVVTVRIPGMAVCTVTTPFSFQRQGS